jgi:hypothetical protein
MRYSITLLKFAKRAQIPFGAFVKGNLLPFGIYDQKQKDYFLNVLSSEIDQAKSRLIR